MFRPGTNVTIFTHNVSCEYLAHPLLLNSFPPGYYFIADARISRCSFCSCCCCSPRYCVSISDMFKCLVKCVIARPGRVLLRQTDVFFMAWLCAELELKLRLSAWEPRLRYLPNPLHSCFLISKNILTGKVKSIRLYAILIFILIWWNQYGMRPIFNF